MEKSHFGFLAAKIPPRLFLDPHSHFVEQGCHIATFNWTYKRGVDSKRHTVLRAISPSHLSHFDTSILANSYLR
jgi:hypothetical protein